MNNSEPLSSLEEKWTAYLDGKLPATEAAAFERENPEARAEREMHAQLMAAVRQHSPAPQLRNADFFNESILREISVRPAETAPEKKRAVWPIWRLAFAAACCLLAVVGVWATFVRGTTDAPDRYVAQIVSVTAGDDSIDASVVDADGVKVLWINGLETLPSNYVLE